MKVETYYSVEYRVGNSWQPLAPRYPTFREANEEFARLISENSSHPEGKLTDEVRIVQHRQQVFSEEIKSLKIA